MELPQGCASSLRLTCQNCAWMHLFWTSKRKEKSFEVNRRLVYGMRRIGKGHSGASKFCSVMNMPPPPRAKSFKKSSHVIAKHAKTVAMNSMKAAAEEVCSLKGNEDADGTDPVNCGISCDGTWQRRGHSSLNGCVTVMSIDTGKVLDVETLTTLCKECGHYDKLDKDSVEYLKWKLEHKDCNANFKGSAPAMEPEGAARIFARSLSQNNLRYTMFYGDGDSKSFSEVRDVYKDEGLTVEKKECIGHVQKRVGTALRKLKKDNPSLGGKAKLTNATIDKLQNYYGIAIRSNIGNLKNMQKDIHASLFHIASNDDHPYHTHCPTGSDSWCRYQQDRANKTKLHKHGAGLPKEVIKLVKPIYQRLSDSSLLEKCLHGKTQNQNEALNGLIWQRIPKEVFVHKNTMELGVYDAVSHFNMGSKAIIDLLNLLNITPGKYTEAACQLEDKSRVSLAEYKSTSKVKKRRKVIRGLKKTKR